MGEAATRFGGVLLLVGWCTSCVLAANVDGVRTDGGRDQGIGDGGPGIGDAGPCIDDADSGSTDSGVGGCACGECAQGGTCPAGEVCGAGTCVAACGADAVCASTLDCCGGLCVNPSFDAFNCGTCATGCQAGEFCASGCLFNAFQNICANPRAVVIYDGHEFDDEAGDQLRAALTNGCSPSVEVSMANEMDGGAVNPVTGAPQVSPGTTFVVPGGSFGQMSVTYVDATGESPVYFQESETNYAFINRSTGNPIVDVPICDLTANHDYFLIETLVDGPSGTFSIFANGFYAPGTMAAAWYFNWVVLPQRLSENISWMVVEWIDADGNGIPDSADTFNVLAGH
jgi:hypothetical protein